MEKKKTFDLESKRKIYFSLGLFIVSAGGLCAFTYRTPIYLKNNTTAIEQEVNVPLLLVENETKPEKPDIPIVEKVPELNPSTPIFSDDLLNNITLIRNTNITPGIILTGSNPTNLVFNVSLRPTTSFLHHRKTRNLLQKA